MATGACRRNLLLRKVPGVGIIPSSGQFHLYAQTVTAMQPCHFWLAVLSRDFFGETKSDFAFGPGAWLESVCGK